MATKKEWVYRALFASGGFLMGRLWNNNRDTSITTKEKSVEEYWDSELNKFDEVTVFESLVYIISGYYKLITYIVENKEIILQTRDKLKNDSELSSQINQLESECPSFFYYLSTYDISKLNTTIEEIHTTVKLPDNLQKYSFKLKKDYLLKLSAPKDKHSKFCNIFLSSFAYNYIRNIEGVCHTVSDIVFEALDGDDSGQLFEMDLLEFIDYVKRFLLLARPLIKIIIKDSTKVLSRDNDSPDEWGFLSKPFTSLDRDGWELSCPRCKSSNSWTGRICLNNLCRFPLRRPSIF
ncbi:hypothetical protein [Desulfotignum phosphitoxidans]|uniref:Uncharacterized protein n=1 Tax=Desulfotignum phosphitoxidans DSM 13687 TaxID=1286635 RepID=S0FZS5_9BACT|nr:hypothetical protein [Desulfotignum phosphitoxidans]EMS78474.1 hypothetical protein Dpo_8c01410 [Desulfotignum phosphitoxidans DSM 13687]EMS80160.1 hypothetical protein Dpo_3c03040 [Desulfotignum phosphitoxidans DSM 13687]